MSGNSEELLNSIFLGEVASVHNYGAFIRIPGNKNQGLVHKSQVSKSAVDDVTEILQKGERIWCKVINIMEDGKIGLSMKVVDQGSGRDLDPNGVQIHQDEQRRKSMPFGGGRKKISLEAVLKTTCSKCGITGHLAKDCFQSASGKIYELIPEPDVNNDLISTSNNPPLEKEKQKKAKKRKKEKKHKKEKKKKRRSSSSEVDSDTSSGREQKRYKNDRDRSHSPKKKRK